MQTNELTQEGLFSVIAAVIKQNGRYLVCQRPSHKRHGNLWEFPGGKLEPGETLEAAARRELKEELNLEVTAIGRVLLAVQDPGSLFLVNFLEVEVSGNPEALEHAALLWAQPEQLITLPLAPTDRKFTLFLNSTPKTGFE